MSAAFQFLLLRCVDDYTSLSEKQYSCAIPSDTSDAAIQKQLTMLQLELDADHCKLDDLFQRLRDLIGRWKQQIHAMPAGSSVRNDASSAFYSFIYAHNLLRLLPAVSKLQCSISGLIHGSAHQHAVPTNDPAGPALEVTAEHKLISSGHKLQQPGSADPTSPTNEPAGSTPSVPPKHEQDVSPASMGPQQRRHTGRRTAIRLLKRFAQLSHAKQRFLDRPASIKHRQILSRRKWFLRSCTCHRCRWTGPWIRRYYPTRREMERLYGTAVSRNSPACIRRQYGGAPFDPGSNLAQPPPCNTAEHYAAAAYRRLPLLLPTNPVRPSVRPDVVFGREHAWLWDQLVRTSREEHSNGSRATHEPDQLELTSDAPQSTEIAQLPLPEGPMRLKHRETERQLAHPAIPPSTTNAASFCDKPDYHQPMRPKRLSTERHLAHPTIPPSATCATKACDEPKRCLNESFVNDKNGYSLGYVDDAKPHRHLEKDGRHSPFEPAHFDNLDFFH